MNTSGEYNQIILKLDEFIRKFYKNQLLRGSIYSVGLLLLFYLGASTVEYFGEFNTTVRTVLFYAFILSSAYILTRFIIVPLLKLNKLGKVISHEEAAHIVGSHFSAVQDKLLNVLQLQQTQSEVLSATLLQASINQKIAELKPVPFTSAIDLSENKRYLKYALIPVLVLFGILVVAPKILSTGTERLIHHGSYYEKQAPFTFEIQNKDLKAVQQQDFELKVKIKGDEVPNELFVVIDGNEFKLDKENLSSFTYTFKNIQQNIAFQFSGGGFKSKEYELLALPKPTLMNFDVLLKYPSYLNRKDELLSNTGDLIIPQGTKISWSFNTKNSEFLSLHFSDTLLNLQPSGENKFSFTRRLMQSLGYSINTGNELVKGIDSVNYSINVIADAYPAIEVNEKHDSLKPNAIYFSGMIKDDYGFNQLTFRYNKYAVDSSGKSSTSTKEVVLPIQKNQLSQPYIHYFDVSTLGLKPGDKIEYYFEVWDNDGVNGTKSAKTSIMTFKAPTLEELDKQTTKNNQDIKNDIDESIKKAKDLQKELNELNKKVLEKKQLGWEEKKKIEVVLDKQKELEKKIENIKQENQLNNQQKNEYQQPNENLLEKQKQLEQLFENIMTPEMKKLFDELQKLMEKMDKNKVQETLEKMKMTDKDLEKELDRTLEQFKQMEAEQKMENLTKKLDEIAKKQEELSKETESKKDDKNPADKKDDKNSDKKDDKNADKNNPDKKDDKNNSDKKDDKANEKGDDKKSLEEKQNQLNKEFEKFKEDAKALEQLNKELENPMNMPDTKQEQEKVSQDQQNASEQLNKNNKKGASKSQKNAAEQMKSMAEKMEQAMKQMEQEQNEEDMQTLRQIMENLMNVSFAEEDLAKETQKIKTNNPQYTKLAQKQKKLQDDSKMIEDSLLALSKRNPMISASINREISSIQMNMEKSIDALEERQTQEGAMRQQSAMTSINNLALMLNESLEQMQMQAQAQKKKQSEGDGSCKKPGGKGKKPSPSMANMRQMQEQLNKQIDQMKKMLEEGKKPGGKKPGDKQGNGMGALPVGTSEQLAKMAAEQEAIRRAMQESLQKMQKNGGQNPGGDLAKKMEETENDLVNKMITQETVNRQQQILTKLLEHEKAERERELDEKRQSNEAKNENYSNPNLFLEYKRLKEQELELLKTVPPSLSPYYRTKVSTYFNNFNK